MRLHYTALGTTKQLWPLPPHALWRPCWCLPTWGTRLEWGIGQQSVSTLFRIATQQRCTHLGHGR
eukprot:6033471-Lingulodinium_polyedra.AAC.1